MTTTSEQRGTGVDSGESAEERRAYMEAVLSKVAVTHFDPEATQGDQMPFTD